jgi:hypothetical protein
VPASEKERKEYRIRERSISIIASPPRNPQILHRP